MFAPYSVVEAAVSASQTWILSLSHCYFHIQVTMDSGWSANTSLILSILCDGHLKCGVKYQAMGFLGYTAGISRFYSNRARFDIQNLVLLGVGTLKDL